MIEKIVMAAFVVLLCSVMGYLFLVEPMRVRRAMSGLDTHGFSATDPHDTTTNADIRALLPLPNYRIFISSEKTQGPFTLRTVWKSASPRTYYAYLTRWQRSPEFNVEQGARRNEELSQTCYVERTPHPDQPVVFVGYGVESRGIVNLESYHGVTEAHDALDAAFSKLFSVYALRGNTVRIPLGVQRALLTHAEYIKNAPYASLKFSAEGWAFCRHRIADADAFRTFKAVCDDISKALR